MTNIWELKAQRLREDYLKLIDQHAVIRQRVVQLESTAIVRDRELATAKAAVIDLNREVDRLETENKRLETEVERLKKREQNRWWSRLIGRTYD